MNQHIINVHSIEEVVTWKASIETLIVIALLVWTSFVLDTFNLYALSCLIAPLLLLRSKESQILGINLFQNYVAKSIGKNLGFRIILLIFLPIVSISIRIAATLFHIRNGVKNFPNNWNQTVWGRSLFQSLEFVPGTGSIQSVVKEFKVPTKWSIHLFLGSVFILLIWASLFIINFIGYYLDDQSFDYVPSFLDALNSVPVFIGLFGIFISLFGTLFLSGVFINAIGLFLAVAYRFSLKSTALIWLPLLFSIKNSHNSKSALALFEYERSSRLWELIRFVSLVLIALVILKTVLIPSSMLNETFYENIFVKTYLAPGKMTYWQIASMINAGLILFWYYVFSKIAMRNLEKRRWSNRKLLNVIRYFYIARALITTYTLPILVLITLKAAQLIELDFAFYFSLDPRLFPYKNPSEILIE